MNLSKKYPGYISQQQSQWEYKYFFFCIDQMKPILEPLFFCDSKAFIKKNYDNVKNYNLWISFSKSH